eukprot:scaffold10700_cov90-Skeletonema_dohrnii-CCMP3373.AAC.2
MQAMTEEAPIDNKRRRIAAADDSSQRIGCLTDLPSGILAHAASFLAEPSRILFAVALDRNSAASPNERSAAIVGNEWSILDFGEIEKDLAAKLTDDDIEKVLLCIDAVNKVKRLKLANCVNITGAGLEPLRGSIVIEQIGLSLVAHHKSPSIYPAPPISCNHVIPVLDSIIEREGCALRHLQFPQVWREEPSTDSEFHQFLLRYNQMWENREHVGCLECNQNLPYSGNKWIGTSTHLRGYGTQDHTCYDCFKHYCYDCKIDFCWTCQTDYCEDCTTISDCKYCDNSHCNDCYEHECHECNEKICSKCVEEQYECYNCADCDQVLCSECIDDEDVKTDVYTCNKCHASCCDVCRLRKFRQGQLRCTDCIKQVAPLLVGESMRMCKEIELLKIENKKLQCEIKELRTKESEGEKSMMKLKRVRPILRCVIIAISSVPPPQFVKKRVESLIEREHLERDEADRRVYRYMA